MHAGQNRQPVFFIPERGKTMNDCISCNAGFCTRGEACPLGPEGTEEIIRAGENFNLMKAAAAVESRYYMQKTRIAEVIEFCRLMKYSHLGLAFCVGLSNEAKIAAGILGKHFKITGACCKICGVSKDSLGFEKVRDVPFEATCNPVAQAEVLNQAGTDLNLIIGLCIGHDLVFIQNSKAPVSTLVVKDRVLAHNPAGALYSRYYRRILENYED